jgi:DNA-binding transcriptional LysR family regulator
MTLQQLKYVVKTLECGSISRAATQLYISQPSLSSAIKELENELKIIIFKRSSKGITLSSEGVEFLSYARQIIEQTELLEQHYKETKPSKQLCTVSTQHYAFSVNAFVNLIQKSNTDEYKFTLRETRTYDIIKDVADMRSEIGILYISSFNKSIIYKFLSENNLAFTQLFEAAPHVFVSKNNPLAQKQTLTLDDLQEYPCLSFEQGEYNSFYFSEEILSTVYHKKSILVSDRATLFNLLIGLNGYTICTGVLPPGLNGNDIISIPLTSDEKLVVGWIVNKKTILSYPAKQYILELKKIIKDYGFTILS